MMRKRAVKRLEKSNFGRCLILIDKHGIIDLKLKLKPSREYIVKEAYAMFRDECFKAEYAEMLSFATKIDIEGILKRLNKFRDANKNTK